jgi:hypothetical protein
VQARAANIRAGYVYVISNRGAFGERMVKIGLTRRLDPRDRIYELGDASVPFRYDIHALVFSDDAVGLEARLHQALAHVRVNLVNPRREFFYATPGESEPCLPSTRAISWTSSKSPRRLSGARAKGNGDAPALPSLDCCLALGDQVLGDLGLSFQPGQRRLLIHPGHLLTRG